MTGLCRGRRPIRDWPLLKERRDYVTTDNWPLLLGAAGKPIDLIDGRRLAEAVDVIGR